MHRPLPRALSPERAPISIRRSPAPSGAAGPQAWGYLSGAAMTASMGLPDLGIAKFAKRRTTVLLQPSLQNI